MAAAHTYIKLSNIDQTRVYVLSSLKYVNIMRKYFNIKLIQEYTYSGQWYSMLHGNATCKKWLFIYAIFSNQEHQKCTFVQTEYHIFVKMIIRHLSSIRIFQYFECQLLLGRESGQSKFPRPRSKVISCLLQNYSRGPEVYQTIRQSHLQLATELFPWTRSISNNKAKSINK